MRTGGELNKGAEARPGDLAREYDKVLYYFQRTYGSEPDQESLVMQ